MICIADQYLGVLIPFKEKWADAMALQGALEALAWLGEIYWHKAFAKTDMMPECLCMWQMVAAKNPVNLTCGTVQRTPKN